mgnify:CR=1 FL=1
MVMRFQSTLPAKGATVDVRAQGYNDFVSIHAPREGSDQIGEFGVTLYRMFQSTLPAKGATQYLALLVLIVPVSIHAPREGSDVSIWEPLKYGFVSIHAPREGSDSKRYRRNKHRTCFNPRSPRRERHQHKQQCYHQKQFQSTLPAKGATLTLYA